MPFLSQDGPRVEWDGEFLFALEGRPATTSALKLLNELLVQYYLPRIIQNNVLLRRMLELR